MPEDGWKRKEGKRKKEQCGTDGVRRGGGSDAAAAALCARRRDVDS